jgi:hypothetical protein
MEECGQFGKVKSVICPREGRPVGSGPRVFVEMENEEGARQVIIGLKGRTFDGRVVDVNFFPLAHLHSKRYYETIPITIIATQGAVTAEQIM